MPVQIDVNNQFTSSHNFFLRQIARYCLKKLEIKKSVSIALIGEAKIKKLNKTYRRKDKVTDVLSFGDWNDEKFLGEVIICLPQAVRQAKKYGTSLRQELARLLTHGILHLAGFDHEKSKREERKMFNLQEKILKKL